MAAGGITYDMVLPRRVATLPSVEMWGNNMNILKDPPKGIYTRRIDKVGDTQEITMDIDGAGDRICEMIKVYGRGINQMVGVNYSNYGTSGGQVRQVPTRTGTAGFYACGQGAPRNNIIRGGVNLGPGIMPSTGISQASLPYKAFDNGAFRPPIRRQEDDMPLSRMPRVWTYAMTNKSFPINVKKMECHTEQDRCIKSEGQIIRNNIRPTATYNLGPEGVSELDTSKYINEDVIVLDVDSGTRTLDVTEIQIAVPLKEVRDERKNIEMYTNIKNIREIKNNELDSKRFIQDPLNYTVNSGIYESKNNSKNSELDSKRYIQDALNSEVYTNKKKSSNLANIYDDLDTRKFIKNNIKYEVNSGYNLQTKDGEYIHSQLINKNNRPTAPAYTNNLGYTRNNTDNTVVLDKEILKNPINTNKADYCKDPYIINSRNAKLNRKISAGSFIRENYGKIIFCN